MSHYMQEIAECRTQREAADVAKKFGVSRRQAISDLNAVLSLRAQREKARSVSSSLPAWQRRQSLGLTYEYVRRQCYRLLHTLRTSTHGATQEVKFAGNVSPKITSITARSWPATLGLPASYCRGTVPTSHHTWWLPSPTQWLAIPARLRCLDGLITVTCEAVDADTYRATWVRQGRGFDVVQESGWIVRTERGGWTHTQRDPAIARTRPTRQATLPESCWPTLTEALEIDPSVTLAHARAAGLCLPGCKDWAEKNLHGSLKPLKASRLWALASLAGDRLHLVERAIRCAAAK